MNKLYSYCPALFSVALLIGISGCSLCCGPDDFNYGTYGGLHPRADMRNGRVGSIFSDPSGTTMNLVPYGEHASDKSGDGSGDSENKPSPIEDNLPKPKGDDGAVNSAEYQPPERVTPRRMQAPPQRQAQRQAQRQRRSIFGGTRIR